MPLFRRRPRPAWAGPLADDELDAFLRDLRADLDRRGWAYEIGDDALHVSAPWQRTHGLDNLAQTYHHVVHGDRGAVVPTHLDALLATDAEEIPADFSVARALLRVRLTTPEYAAHVDSPVARPVADDLVAVLALDTPTAVHLLSRETVAPWERGDDELFDAGLDAVRGEPGLVTRVSEVEGARITTLLGDSFYTATWALWAGELDPPPAGHGTLVAVPHRHAVLVHEIRDLTAVLAMKQLAGNAVRLHAEGPGSISPSIYWVRDGRFERIATAVTPKTANIVLSDELLDVVNSLG